LSWDLQLALDGLGTPAKLAEKAKQLGFTALAMTDHGNIDGAIKFYSTMKKQGIKPIIGVELYVVDNLYEKPEKEKRYHMLALCKNNKGFVNLMKMLTVSNIDGYHRRPRIDMKLLDLYGSDLIILTACSEGILKRPDGIELAKKLKKKYGEDFYLEIMPHHYKPQVEMNNFLYKLSRELDIPLVSTNDNHYIDKEDSVVQEVLLAIQNKADWKDPKRWKFSFAGLHMRTYDEMLAEYVKQGSDIPHNVLVESLERTMEIADKCNVSLEKEWVDLPLPPVLKGQEEVQALMDLCMEGWKEKFALMLGEEEKVYYDRLEEELQAIISFGYTRYFLLVWDVRRWAREKGMFLGWGRGSAPSSFVCYLLGITGVDPVKYKLLFSRFIAKGRIDLPDIDLDFPDTKRDLIKQYLRDTYGENNVAAISTFMYLHGRSAIKDVARVFDVPLVEVNECTKEIIDYPPGEDEGRSEILESCAQFETVKNFKKKYPQVIKVAAELEGEIRNKGMHAAGMVISSTPLNEGTKCVLHKMKGELVVNWDKYDLDNVGLIKLDVLGLNTLSMFEICLDLIKKNRGIDLDLYSLEPNDRRVFEEFSKGETEGVFQFLSTGLSKYCERIGISDIEDLVALNALHRPGGLKSGTLESYEVLKKGKKRPIYLCEEHKQITEDTFGLVIYQEQIMQIFHRLAGFSWEQADTIRKIVAKSQGEIAFNKYKKEFVDGCLERGTLNREQADALFKIMAFSAGYSFNRSHAVCYTLLGYFCQYLKVYYPAEFILASLMTSDSEKQIDYIREARRLGMKVGTADINRSGLNWEIEGSTLLPGFLIVKGIGDKVAFNIMEFRNKVGVFKSFDHFMCSVEKKAVNKKSVESLVKAGAFDKMESNRNILFAKLNEESTDKVDPLTEEERAKQFDEVMPFEFNPDPLYIYRSLIKELGSVFSIIKIAEATKAVDHPRYFIGKMLSVDFSRKGQDVSSVYGEFEDEGGLANLIFSAKVYGHYKEKIEKLAGKYILILAGYSPTKGSMLADKLWLLDDIVNLNFGNDKLILPLIKNTDLDIDGCSICRECKLRNNAKSPVGVQKGKWNVMIVGEAPGTEEDRLGIPYIGSSGKLLNDTLEKFDLRRDLFYVSNCVKCKPFNGPKDPKTPSLDLVRKCSELWLDNEIRDIAPKIIFATGNTPLYFFTGKETGISDKNATMQWNKKYNCWVIFAMHPASVLYHRENQVMFDQAVRLLAEKIAYLL